MDRSIEDDFTAFVAERAHALLKAAYALTGDPHVAQDLVQSAFAKAFLKWRRISDAPEPYVRRIIYHDFVSMWRSLRRKREVIMAEPPERSDDGELERDAAIRLLLRQALATLPPRQRAVIVLRYLEDFSVEETAAILACGKGTVASQANRALAKLRTAVSHLDGVEERTGVGS